jgi:hypothetical protein
MIKKMVMKATPVCDKNALGTDEQDARRYSERLARKSPTTIHHPSRTCRNR